MGFYDIPHYKSYEDFKKRMEGMAPYKGSKSWPLGSRRYSKRHFVLRETSHGQHVDVYYVDRITREGIEAGNSNISPEYTKRRHLVSVYPDDTVVFFGEIDAGTAPLLTQMFGGLAYVRQDSKRGGAVLINCFGEIYPLYEHARFSLDKMKLKDPVKIFQHKVNRKLVAEAMKTTEEFRLTFPALLRAMTVEGIREVGLDLTDSLSPEVRAYSTSLMKEVMAMIERKHYVDAAVAYSAWSGGTWWSPMSRLISGHSNPDLTTSQVVTGIEDLMDQTFRRHVIVALSAFDRKPIEVGKLPASVWETSIYLHGNLVKRL